ncbi:hypothetical protein WMY93_012430 [Mugilogobius chulae]|uniref:Uncharacterized protein n=1 Tax=Mugilogobius chulae TaxID=88201 RepID=A0AAW0P907_9GOBI
MQMRRCEAWGQPARGGAIFLSFSGVERTERRSIGECGVQSECVNVSSVISQRNTSEKAEIMLTVVRCFTVHISEDAGPRTVVAGVEQDARCTLDQVLTPKFTERFLDTDSSRGIVFITDFVKCSWLRSNPFTVYTVADCADPSSSYRHLVTSQWDVYVHGRNCSNKRTKPQWDMEVLSLFTGHRQHRTECHQADSALFPVGGLVPGPLHRCRVTNSRDFYLSEGNLFVSETLCWLQDSLFELNLLCDIEKDAKVSPVSVHWRVGQGPFRQEHLSRLLEKAAQSDSG